MTGVGDDSRGRRWGRPWLIVGLLLAVGATLAMVLSDDLRFLRLGIVAALWAALIGAFLAVRYRKHAAHSEDAVSEAQAVYELELEREIAARREYELEIEAETREAAQSQSRDELEALRAEVSALRESLQSLLGGEVLLERVALTAQATRMRALNDEQRLVTTGAESGNGSKKPVQLLAPQRPVSETPERQTELMDRVLDPAGAQRRRPQPAANPGGGHPVVHRTEQLTRPQPDELVSSGEPGPESAAARAVKEAERRAEAARRTAESQPTRMVAPVAKPEPAAEPARQAPRLGVRPGPRRRPEPSEPHPEPGERTEISAPARRPAPGPCGDAEADPSDGRRTVALRAEGESEPPGRRPAPGRWAEPEPVEARPAPGQWAEDEPAAESTGRASQGQWTGHDQEPAEPNSRRARWAGAEQQPTGRRAAPGRQPAGEQANGQSAAPRPEGDRGPRWGDEQDERAQAARRSESEQAAPAAGGRQAPTGQWAADERAQAGPGRAAAGRWTETPAAAVQPAPAASWSDDESAGRRAAAARRAEDESDSAADGRRARWAGAAVRREASRRGAVAEQPAAARPGSAESPAEPAVSWKPVQDNASEPSAGKPAADSADRVPSRLQQFPQPDASPVSPLAAETPTGRHGAPADDEPANSILPESVRSNASSGTGGRRRRSEDEPVAASGGRRRRPEGEPPGWQSQRHVEAAGRRAAPESAHSQHSAPETDEPASGRRAAPRAETGSHASGRSVTELLAANGKAESTPRRRRRAED
ncbi:DUF6779 domain-containing protein [Amycolatopsis panacis]|uniref:DUF6779 domain-containing protein n=1 Tax=Amycolatopsis panacis TaxID=2340917 RepID=A0A419I8U5_9PSEU|nr:DUF6779 domain-containing protein [Amycolatopsis panacis]RJQ88600.1 hypothetical protein D5S19_06250 [Amycolatopsis panacis]